MYQARTDSIYVDKQQLTLKYLVIQPWVAYCPNGKRTAPVQRHIDYMWALRCSTYKSKHFVCQVVLDARQCDNGPQKWAMLISRGC